jgi:succinate dehydrogenase/fumarate reductase-like Fe-S protein
MSIPAGRRSALAKLAGAYARHLVRQRVNPGRAATAEEVLATYRADRLRPLTEPERADLPAMSRCINCGLCALVAGRLTPLRPTDLATAYLRDYSLLPMVGSETASLASASTTTGDPSINAALEAASAACPTGVPLAEVAAAVYRLSRP